MKRDANNLKERWENWKAENSNRIKGLSQYNSALALQFLSDMELGLNLSVDTIKGSRSPARLLSLKERILFFGKQFKKTPFTHITKEQAHRFFMDMREGKITKVNGRMYKSTGEYVKDFKCFMAWLKRTKRVKEDISIDLQRKDERKPDWTFISEEDFKKFANEADVEYRTLIWFLYDTGIRPQEAYSVKVCDFSHGFTKLHIRDEIAKMGLGRSITLRLSSTLLREYVASKKLNQDDYIMIKPQNTVNKYLQRHAKKLFGIGLTKARKSYDKMRMYDIRHNSACYWLKRYDKTAQLMYRFGWAKETEIRYYSEFLGMSDEISDENLVTAEDKNALQKEVEQLKKQMLTRDENRDQVIHAVNKVEDKMELFVEAIFESMQNKGKLSKSTIQRIKLKFPDVSLGF